METRAVCRSSIMIYWILPVAQAISCYPVQCANSTSEYGDACLIYSNFRWEVNICSNSSYTCPHPSIRNYLSTLYCEEWVDTVYWDSSSWEDFYGYSVLDKGEVCDPYGLASSCNYKDDLVCHCSELYTCECVEGLAYGDECDGSYPCKPGYVCSSKVCTQMYSVMPGERATDDSACTEGGPLVVLDGYFECPEGDKTTADLPQKCTSDSDCLGTSDETTKCVCGLDTSGSGYCTLHNADLPMQNLWVAQRDYDYEAEIYWKFYTVNYPYLQGDIPTCMSITWRDMTAYLETDLTTSAALGLGVASWVALMH